MFQGQSYGAGLRWLLAIQRNFPRPSWWQWHGRWFTNHTVDSGLFGHGKSVYHLWFRCGRASSFQRSIGDSVLCGCAAAYWHLLKSVLRTSHQHGRRYDRVPYGWLWAKQTELLSVPVRVKWTNFALPSGLFHYLWRVLSYVSIACHAYKAID